MSLDSNLMKSIWVLENIHKNKKFFMNEIELLYLIASVTQWKKFYPSIPTYLVCTHDVHSYLYDLDLIYLWDYVDLNILSDRDEIDRSIFWACSKVKAMKNISTPFVLIDNDLYIKNQIADSKDFDEFDVIISHEEYGPGYYPLASDNIFKDLKNKHQTDYAGRSYNVSFLYMKNEDFKIKYAERSFEWMATLSENRKKNPDLVLHGGHMIFCEQKLLYDMSKADNIQVKSIIPDIFDCKKNIFLSQSKIQSQIDHLGPLKRHIEYNGEIYLNRKSDVLVNIRDYHNLKHIFESLKKNKEMYV